MWLGHYRREKLQSVTNSESLTNLKIIITKCDKKLLQSVTRITESGRIYYKVWQLLQSVKGGYYKVWQVLQSVPLMTKWDVTISWIIFDHYFNQCILNILSNKYTLVDPFFYSNEKLKKIILFEYILS